MFERFFGKSVFLKKMNSLMKTYAVTKNSQHTYDELMKLERYIRTDGERDWFRLNKAALLYDLHLYEAAWDEINDIHPMNPEFAARVAEVKTRLMRDM